MVRRYWGTVLHRAWRDSLNTLAFSSAGRVLLAAAVGLGVMLALLTWGSPDALADESIVRLASIAVPVGLLPVVFLWHLLRAPSAIHQEQAERLTTLENAWKPWIQLSLTAPNPFTRADYGRTSTTLGGKKQVVITTGFATFLTVNCANIGGALIEKCEAYLTSVWFSDAGGAEEQILIQSIPLRWLPIIDDAKYVTAIPSGGLRTMVVLSNVQGNIYFPTDQLPADHIHIFQRSGVFKIRVTACPHNSAPVALDFQLDTRVPGQPTVERTAPAL